MNREINNIVYSFCAVLLECYALRDCTPHRAEDMCVTHSFPSPSLYLAQSWAQCTPDCSIDNAVLADRWIPYSKTWRSTSMRASAHLSVPRTSFLSISPLWDGPCIPHASGPPAIPKPPSGKSIIRAMSEVGEFSWASSCLWATWKEGLLSFLPPLEDLLSKERNTAVLNVFLVILKHRING